MSNPHSDYLNLPHPPRLNPLPLRLSHPLSSPPSPTSSLSPISHKFIILSRFESTRRSALAVSFYMEKVSRSLRIGLRVSILVIVEEYRRDHLWLCVHGSHLLTNLNLHLAKLLLNGCVGKRLSKWLLICGFVVRALDQRSFLFVTSFRHSGLKSTSVVVGK